MLGAVNQVKPLELPSGSLATRRRLAPSWPCRVLLLAVAVLRTVPHVLRIGQDVRSTLRRLQHRRRRSSTLWQGLPNYYYPLTHVQQVTGNKEDTPGRAYYYYCLLYTSPSPRD